MLKYLIQSFAEMVLLKTDDLNNPYKSYIL